MKYDADTVRAIKESIEHHEENVWQLRNGASAREIDISEGACALCRKFEMCQECPLRKEGYGCLEPNSPYRKVSKAWHMRDTKAMLKAEENMVSVLKSLLSEEPKFKVGDRVRISNRSNGKIIENDNVYPGSYYGTLDGMILLFR